MTSIARDGYGRPISHELRIAVTGVSSTGKSRLAKELAQLLHLPYLCEDTHGAFEVLKKQGLDLGHTDPSRLHEHGDDVVAAFETAYLFLRFQQEDEALNGFVADGGSLDHAMYLLYSCSRFIETTAMRPLIERCWQRLEQYDYVYYLPRILPVENNNYRITNEFMLKGMDFMLGGMIATARNRHHLESIYALDTPVFDERVSTVLDRIHNDYKQRKGPWKPKGIPGGGNVIEFLPAPA